MTLYELCDCITIQGNIILKVFDEHGDEIENHYYREQYEFNIAYTDQPDLDEAHVTYMYSVKSYDGISWLVIELTREE